MFAGAVCALAVSKPAFRKECSFILLTILGYLDLHVPWGSTAFLRAAALAKSVFGCLFVAYMFHERDVARMRRLQDASMPQNVFWSHGKFRPPGEEVYMHGHPCQQPYCST